MFFAYVLKISPWKRFKKFSSRQVLFLLVRSLCPGVWVDDSGLARALLPLFSAPAVRTSTRSGWQERPQLSACPLSLSLSLSLPGPAPLFLLPLWLSFLLSFFLSFFLSFSGFLSLAFFLSLCAAVKGQVWVAPRYVLGSFLSECVSELRELLRDLRDKT